MRRLRTAAAWTTWLWAALAAGAARAQDPDQPPPAPVAGLAPAPAGDPSAAGGPPGADIQTKGPVHEAFANPVVFDAKPNPVIPQPPPAAVQEMPPDQKPEGSNIQWIGGYWAWDDSRNDYLWISGVWRNIPPGRQWVPGYWHQVTGGVQWVPGMWMSTQQNSQAQYYPPPPASLESGPNSPAPTPNATWSPGCWLWQGSAYAWRPGFWINAQPNWVWVPAQYVWTPSGYAFVDGYWDRPIAVRGQLFAPVYYSQPLYAQPGYVFQPSIGIVAPALMGSLFVRPSFGVYYFGDFYAQTNVSIGIYPWFAFHGSRFGYDPLFSYYSVAYRTTNPQWVVQIRESYVYRVNNVVARPPATYREMIRVTNVNNVVINNTIVNNNFRNSTFAAPVARLAVAEGSAMKFARIDAAQQRVIAAQSRELQAFRDQRARSETLAAREHGGALTRPRAMELPRSPVAHAAAAHAAVERNVERGVERNAERTAEHEHEAAAAHHTPPATPAHPEALDRGHPAVAAAAERQAAVRAEAAGQPGARPGAEPARTESKRVDPRRDDRKPPRR